MMWHWGLALLGLAVVVWAVDRFITAAFPPAPPPHVEASRGTHSPNHPVYYPRNLNGQSIQEWLDNGVEEAFADLEDEPCAFEDVDGFTAYICGLSEHEHEYLDHEYQPNE